MAEMHAAIEVVQLRQPGSRVGEGEGKMGRGK